MQGTGNNVDWATGELIDTPRQGTRERLERAHLEQARQRAVDLRQALSDGEGHALIRMVEARLGDRLTVIMEQDDECKAYLHLLRDLGRDLDYGALAAAKLVHAQAR